MKQHIWDTRTLCSWFQAFLQMLNLPTSAMGDLLLTLSRMLRTRAHASSSACSFRSSALSWFPSADSTSFKILSCHSNRSTCFSRQTSCSPDVRLPANGPKSEFDIQTCTYSKSTVTVMILLNPRICRTYSVTYFRVTVQNFQNRLNQDVSSSLNCVFSGRSFTCSLGLKGLKEVGNNNKHEIATWGEDVSGKCDKTEMCKLWWLLEGVDWLTHDHYAPLQNVFTGCQADAEDIQSDNQNWDSERYSLQTYPVWRRTDLKQRVDLVLLSCSLTEAQRSELWDQRGSRTQEETHSWMWT